MTTRTLQIEVDQTGDAESGLGNLSDMLGSGISTAAGIAVSALAAVTAAAVGVGAAAIDAWTQMDEGVDNFTVRTGITGDALDSVQESIERLSESSAGVGHNLGTIGDVLGALESRVDATDKEIEGLGGSILKMSRITGSDAVRSTELLTRTMGDWSVSVEKSSDLMDMLTVAHQKSGIEVDALMQKLVQFGAPLRQMGFSLEDSIALFSKWEREGVNAELVMGSLRIAAGHFAKEQEKLNTHVVGGVKSMEDATDKLGKLKNQLQIAKMRQGEFNEKTKESTKLQSQMRIGELTEQIQELEAAMAQGEIRTVTTTGAQKSLKDSLLETFNAIKNATSETEALGIAMEIFGARAGPDMAAAIREGRFSIDDMVSALQDSSGALDRTADATLDFTDRFGMEMQRAKNSLVPLGQAIMDFADQYVIPGVTYSVDILASFSDRVSKAYESGGLEAVWSLIQADMALLGNTINTEVQRYSVEFWKWIDDTISKAPANFALLQNTIKTQITFAWPGIEAGLAEWGTKFWNWTLSAVTGTNTSMANLTGAINQYITTHQADIEGFGKTIGSYVYTGLTGTFADAKNSDSAIQTLVSSLAKSIVNIYSSLVTAGVNMASGMLQGIIEEWSGQKANTRLQGAIKGEIIGVVTSLNPLAWFTPVGRGAIDGMIKGINEGISSLKRAAENAAISAYNAMMRALRANSPSELIAKNVGETAIGGGVIEGMDRARAAVTGAAQNMLGGAVSTPVAPMQASGTGQTIVVNITYAPVVSTADKYEVETKLIPLIKENLRIENASL